MLVALALAGALGGAVYLWAVSYSGNSRYELLFSDLDARDASEITQKLVELKVPYRLSTGGSAITVPAASVHTARLSLAGDGLPRGGVVGFELLDKSSLGATDFDRRMSYLRALSGELVRTIREIDGVEDARVHVAIPENTYFASKARPVTAAVFLKMSPRCELSRAQVKGIVHLVSRSVEGLLPEDVAVVDLYGRLLSGDGSSQAAGAGSVAGLGPAETFQAELEKGLQSLLERVLGQGNVVTRVRAELDLDQKTVDKTLYQPASDGILRSLQELEETFKGEGTAASGVPGTTSNIPQYQVPGQQGSSEWHKRDATRNYEVSEVKERTVIAPGAVKRLSVAVVVNKVLDEGSREAIERIVEAAIGFDSGRRDNVTVTGIAFDTSLLDAVKKQMETPPKPAQVQYPRSLIIAAAAAGGLVLVLLLFLLARRRKRASGQQALNPAQAIMAAAQAATDRNSVGTLPPLVDPEQEKKRRLKEAVEKAARQSPESAAQLIRTWLLEDRR